MKALHIGIGEPAYIRYYPDRGFILPGYSEPVSPLELDFDCVFVSERNRGGASWPALVELARWNKPVFVIGAAGKVLASHLPTDRAEGPQYVAQMRARLDERRRLIIARAIVEAKTGVSFASCRSVAAIYSYEGKLAAEDWKRLGVERTSRYSSKINRLATNETACVLNYASGIAYARARMALAQVGLSPHVGMLHTEYKGKEPGVYDAVELLRPVVEPAALDWLRTLPRAAKNDPNFVRHLLTWTVRLSPKPALLLSRHIEDTLSRRVSVKSMRMTVDALFVRELRRLAQWFMKPTDTFSFVRLVRNRT